MPENSNWRFANEKCDREICAPSPDGRAEGQSRVSLHWPPWSSPKWSQLHVLGNHRWRMLGLRVWPGNKANVLPVEHDIISLTEDTTAGEVQCQDHVDCVLQHWGLVHRKYVPRGQLVNKDFHKRVLQRHCNAVCRHRPENWQSSNWIPHHDNAPAYRAVVTNEFLGKYVIPSLPHPPYSPDLAPCEFFLFPQLKKITKGRQFNYLEEIQANVTRQLKATTKSDYQRCFRQWQECWNKCIQAQGHYFERDNIN